MSDPEPEQEDRDAKSMFGFLDEEKAMDEERLTGRQPPESLPGARRSMPIIRRPVPVSESGPIRPPGQENKPGVESDEFEFLHRQSSRQEARAVSDEAAAHVDDNSRPDSGYARPIADEDLVAVVNPIRRFVGLFALLLVACGAVIYAYDYWPWLDRSNSDETDPVSSAGLGEEAGVTDKTGISVTSPDPVPTVQSPAPRADSVGARFRDSVESLEALLAEGRLVDAEVQIAGLDRTVYGYGFSEFKAIEARVAAARNGAAAEPTSDAERLAEEDRLADEARLAEETRLAEAARLAEDERLAERARVAEEARVAEAARLAEDERLAEQARVAEEVRIVEAARAAEERRLADEARAAEGARVAEAQAAEARAAEVAGVAKRERLAEAGRTEDSRRLADEIALSEGAARVAEAERRADAAATNALVTAASGSTPEEQADAMAAAREATRAAALERAAEVERRRVARTSANVTEEVPTGATQQRAETSSGTGNGTTSSQRAADRRATTMAADRAATDRRIAEQRGAARSATDGNANSTERGSSSTIAADARSGTATDIVSANPRLTAPEPERIEIAATTPASTADRPAIGDEDLQIVYGRFMELANAVEQRDIRTVITLTRPSGVRIQQFLQVFENSEALEARITNVSMRKADAEITGMLRIDTIQRSDGSRVRPPPGLEAVALSSTRDDSGWSALVW